MEALKEHLISPDIPGAYFEARCKNNTCSKHNKKIYIFITSNATFDYFEENQRKNCEDCQKNNLSICNIGFIGCK